MKNKQIIKSYILDYLKKKVPDFKKKGKMLLCPKCRDEKLTANIFPMNSNELFCFSPDCQKIGNIFQICRDLEFDGNKDVSDEYIAKHLIKMFSIKTEDHINQLLDKYSSWNWDLVPCSKDRGKNNSFGKASDVEKGWEKKNHKDIREWQQWIKNGLNFGNKTGAISNTLCIDIDLVESKLKKRIYEGNPTEKMLETAKQQYEEGIKKIKEKLPFLDWDTVRQETFGGIHFFYIMDSEIPKTCFDDEGLHIDIEADGGQVVIEPSVVGGQKRVIIGEEIKPLSKEVKDWILKKRSKDKEEIEELAIIENKEDEGLIKGLEGCCNATFVKVGGKFRQFLTTKETEQALYIINNDLLDDPMDKKIINALCQQLKKYDNLDETILYKKVFEFLTKHEEATMRDLKECLGAESKDLKEVLAQLIKENKVYKHKSMYKAINKAEWKTEFIQESKVLNYSIPYFDDYAVFRRGDMICIGAKTGVGKSYIALNIIRKLLENKIQPNGGIRYLSSEPGNRFAKIAMELGLKEGDFYFCNHYQPEKIELEDEAVTIIDWLLPDDFSQTANLYKIFARQLDKHGGTCYIFSQLKDNGEFYAEQMVKFFASFASKYFYTEQNGTRDSQNTYFKTEKIRESKTMQQYITIPTYFNDDKKLELKK